MFDMNREREKKIELSNELFTKAEACLHQATKSIELAISDFSNFDEHMKNHKYYLDLASKYKNELHILNIELDNMIST